VYAHKLSSSCKIEILFSSTPYREKFYTQTRYQMDLNSPQGLFFFFSPKRMHDFSLKKL
jgi:hypothetical protein